MACKRLTWADFYLTAIKGTVAYGYSGAEPFEKYPGLQKVAENVESIESIQKWLAERPETDFQNMGITASMSLFFEDREQLEAF